MSREELANSEQFEIEMDNMDGRAKESMNPLHDAVSYSTTEKLISLLNDETLKLDTKDKNKNTAFMKAIKCNHKEHVRVFIQHRRWREVMDPVTGGKSGCCTDVNSNTPMRALVKHMPDMAVLALNKCIELQPDGKQFKLDCSYLDQRKCKIKTNHVLYYTGFYNRSEVLHHPVTIALVDYKWRKSACWFYAFSLLFYMAFLCLLTIYVVSKHTSSVANLMKNSTIPVGANGNDIGKNGPPKLHTVVEFPLYVFTSVLGVRTISLLIVNPANFLTYLTELGVYSCSIALLYRDRTVALILNEYALVPITIFLSWLNLFMRLRKLPMYGIYFIMFTRILRTLLTILVLFFPLLSAFALTFHMLLTNMPLFSIERVYATIIVMMAGEIGYSDTILASLLKENPAPYETVLHPGTTIVIFVGFVILIVICLVNMLVGLAVSDVDKLYKESENEMTSLRVDEVLTYDMLWANIGLSKRFAVKEIIFDPSIFMIKPGRFGFNVVKWFLNWFKSNVGYDERLKASKLRAIVKEN